MKENFIETLMILGAVLIMVIGIGHDIKSVDTPNTKTVTERMTEEIVNETNDLVEYVLEEIEP